MQCGLTPNKMYERSSLGVGHASIDSDRRSLNAFNIAQVVLLSNSDIVFDESLARLGDPSTLDMTNKVKRYMEP